MGEENQSLPLLIFAGDAPADVTVKGETHFIQDTKRILQILAERHGFPQLH